ncbi:MAG: alanine--glyoxylate aminotransferase family protein [Gemmatimonadetes bacterium]|nr:alanine--glyoxylate aminotransferase family protein [Gemmatimonadota bacterium]
MMEFGRNFLPGPTGVHPEVLASLTAPMFAHYGPKMRPFLEEIQPALREMFGTSRPVFTVTCSGTGMMEMAIRNSVRDRVLVVVSGFFGEYFARIAEECGKEVVRVHVPFGQVISGETLEMFLDGPRVDAVALVHSESSSGALAPLDAIAGVVRRHDDVMLLVDGISSAAGIPIEMDRLGIDFMITGSQKALSLPPGLAFGAVSERLEARAREVLDVGRYFSVTRWVRMAVEMQLFETPALSLYLALVCQLRRIAERGGWPARWANQRALAESMWQWVDRQEEVRYFTPAGQRTPTVSVLDVGPHRDARELIAQLDAAGYAAAWAVDQPTDRRILRIGHMGDLEPGHLETFLGVLGPLLSGRGPDDHSRLNVSGVAHG